MPRYQKQQIENVLELVPVPQANHLQDAIAHDRLFSVNGREMAFQLPQMLITLHYYVSQNPVLLCLNPIHYFDVISEVSGILNQALSLACVCKRKTIFRQLFIAMNRARFHKLYHLLDTCIYKTNRLLIIYDPGFNRLLANGLSYPLVWSCMATAENCGDELRFHQTLMILTEITTQAEYKIDLRCKAFKTNSKAIVELLLKVVKESEDCTSKVLAIRSIGSLARIFRESNNHRVLSALVSQLENEDREVVSEALVALIKFACEKNYLCRQHSNMMIELKAAQLLVKLFSEGERESRVQFHGLKLMCCIASKADYSAAVDQDMVATAIRQLLTEESGRRRAFSRHPELKVLATRALDRLTLYYRY